MPGMFDLAELHLVHVGPFLKFTQVNSTTHLGVISELAENTLDPTVYVRIDKDVVRDHIKDLAQVQIDDINCPFFVCGCFSSQKSTRLVRHNLPLVKPCSLSQINLSSMGMCSTVSFRRICPMIFPQR